MKEKMYKKRKLKIRQFHDIEQEGVGGGGMRVILYVSRIYCKSESQLDSITYGGKETFHPQIGAPRS